MWSWKSCGSVEEWKPGSLDLAISDFSFFLGLGSTQIPLINKNDINCNCPAVEKSQAHGFWIPPNTTHTTLSKNSWHHARVMHVSLFRDIQVMHTYIWKKTPRIAIVWYLRARTLFVVISCCYLTSFWSVHAYFLSTRVSFDEIHLNRAGISINRIQLLYQGQLAFLYKLMPLSQTKISVQWTPLTWKHQTRNSKTIKELLGTLS